MESPPARGAASWTPSMRSGRGDVSMVGRWGPRSADAHTRAVASRSWDHSSWTCVGRRRGLSFSETLGDHRQLGRRYQLILVASESSREDMHHHHATCPATCYSAPCGVAVPRARSGDRQRAVFSSSSRVVSARVGERDARSPLTFYAPRLTALPARVSSLQPLCSPSWHVSPPTRRGVFARFDSIRSVRRRYVSRADAAHVSGATTSTRHGPVADWGDPEASSNAARQRMRKPPCPLPARAADDHRN